ncbi:MAG: hypothetical protein K9K67_10015 [Bacteriovoracaceae bacterium]|nr:hypothetical protein [Bacteriovoracaceae bacterium]
MDFKTMGRHHTLPMFLPHSYNQPVYHGLVASKEAAGLIAACLKEFKE